MAAIEESTWGFLKGGGFLRMLNVCSHANKQLEPKMLQSAEFSMVVIAFLWFLTVAMCLLSCGIEPF